MIICSRPVSVWLGMLPDEGTADVYVEGSPVDAIVSMALVAMALAVIIARRDRVRSILRRNFPILLFFLFAALSILWSDFPFVTLKHWVKGVGDLMMVLILLTEPHITDSVKRLITRTGFVLIPLSVLFIKYYPTLGRTLTKGWAAEWIGVATQKNSLGELCAVLGLGLLWCFRRSYNDRNDACRGRRLLGFGTVLAMIVWLLYMCNSLTSICALAMAGGLMLLSGRPCFRSNASLVHLVTATMLMVTTYALFFQSSASLVQGLGRNPTLTGRTKIWAAVLSVPDSRLVGTGYETFWVGPRLEEVWTLLGMEINESHDGYTEMLLNLGWLGLGLLGVLIASGYRKITQGFRLNPEYSGLTLAFFLNALITGFTEAAFRMRDPVWFCFLLAATAVPEGGTNKGAYSLQLDRYSVDRELSFDEHENMAAPYWLSATGSEGSLTKTCEPNGM